MSDLDTIPPAESAASTAPADGGARYVRLVLILVGLAAIIVYLNSLANGFAYDDVAVIQSRELLHDLGRLPEIVTAEYWHEPGAGFYRPVTLVTYAVDWALWGGEPFGFHLTNVLLHAAVSLLVALLFLRFFPWWGALAGGLVFAIHPVHTEAVANVVGRAELLTAVFVLAACIIYVRASERDRIAPRHAMAIGLLYVLAMLSKESGVLLPGLLLFLDLPARSVQSAGGIGRYVQRRVPLFLALSLLLAGYFVIRWVVLDAIVGVAPDRAFAPDDSLPTRLFTMSRVWPRYYQLLFFPTHLSADYSPAVILPVSRLTWMGALGFALLTATLMLAAGAWRRAPELTAATGWAVISLLPVSNLLFAGQFVLAERTLYLPSLAVSMGLGMLLTRSPRTIRKGLAAGLAVWIVAFSVVTVRRNPVWEATHTVWDDVRRNHPESSKLVWGLGVQSLRKGDWPEARRMFERSLELWPYHGPYLMELAGYLVDRGELEEAERFAAAAVELAPDHADYYVLLAYIRWQRGDPDAALRTTGRGLAMAGEDEDLYALRADIEASRGNYAAAAEEQLRSINSAGRDAQAEAWLRLAGLRAVAGDTLGALDALERFRRAVAPSEAAGDSLERALDAGEGGEGPP